MNENYEWFVKNYDELIQTYGDSFIAIKNKAVLHAYDSYAQAVRETQKTEELGTFIVQECKKSGEMFQCHIASMNFA